MNPYTPFFETARKLLDPSYVKHWEHLTTTFFQQKPHGDWERWLNALQQLPKITPISHNIAADTISIGHAQDLSTQQQQQLVGTLKALCPWRKGPFSFFDIFIDTEWRSDWKWQRLAPHITPLRTRRVADIGCGNGYYAWRMAAQEASLVLGIDSTPLYTAQFMACQNYLQNPRIAVLPLHSEDFTTVQHCFDTVFSMGVLYHVPEPLAHLKLLRQLLDHQGELVLETLVIDGKHGELLGPLHPQARYAQMRNVSYIPSCATVQTWLKQSGFSHTRCVDVTVTTTQEQRSTPWMTFQSLKDFLDPQDHTRTIEGYPAPCRAIFIATAS